MTTVASFAAAFFGSNAFRITSATCAKSWVAKTFSKGRYLDARSRRMIAIAEREELALRVLKGKLHRAEDVEFFMSNRDTAIRARILAISSRITRILVGKIDPAEIRAIIDAETFSALDELANYDPTQFNEQNEEYLAKLFPEAPAVKPNGNGDGDSEAEEIESDVE